MANTIKIKRSSVSGKVPTTSQLELGELAVNTHDGKLYTKKDDGTAAVVEIGGASASADSLTTARDISLSGDVSGSTSFDGSANVTITATVADDSHNHIISNVDGLQTALDAKAPLASPTFTGTPAAPTAAAGTNTTQVATTAFVSTAVANVVDAAPGALDTLNELAAALGDDANFSTTVTNSIATKLPLAGGQMTGNITFSSTQTVDGRDLSVDGAKLDGIEAGATADQTASEILTAIKTVDGSGSGLDADTVDGLNSSSFLRSDANDTATGIITFQNGTDYQIALNGAGTSWAGISFTDSGGSDYLWFNGSNGTFALGGGGSNVAGKKLHVDGGLSVGSTADSTSTPSNGIYSQGEISVGANTVWHAGNDGSGSGLDADLLDGQQGAYYLNTSSSVQTKGGDLRVGGSTYNIAIGTGNNSASNTIGHTATYNEGIFWHSSNSNYAIYRTSGNWSAPNYDQLALNWPTGIQLDGGTSYGLSGVRVIGNNNSLTVNGNIVLNAGNYTSYAPSLTGSGASGSWGISVTGSSASCTGNASTASTLQTARTISLSGDVSGSASFNGGSNVTISATVADDSHNHVVSNVDGLQSSLDAKANLSGATFTGEVQINARLDVGAPGNDHEIRIYKSDNNVSDHIQFYNGTTRVGEIGCKDNTWLRINQDTDKPIYTPRYIRADSGFFVNDTTKGINGSGNFIGGTIAGASDYGTLLRSDANDTATGILTFNAACRGQVDALSSASTITPNFNNSNNFSISLSTNTTIANPSNLTAGQSGAIAITYNGGYTVAFGSYWKFPGGTAPTATSTSGKTDVLVYYVESSTRISAQLLLNMGG